MNRHNPLSEPVQDYLKAIYQLGYLGSGALVQDIAAQVGVSNAGVSKMLRQLQKLGFIQYTPYQPVFLTTTGQRIALEVIRHHRLIELYLIQGLGYGWDQVHSEAERLEHHISEEFEELIDRMLGYPEFDPHGDPIPGRDGSVPTTVTVNLAMQPDGATIVIRRVTDEDPQLLRYFAERGLRPGIELQLLDREPFGGPLRVRVDGRDERISPQAAQHIFVERLSAMRGSVETGAFVRESIAE